MVEMSLSEMWDMHGSGTVYHVDGRNPPVEVGSLSHYLQGFIYSMPGGAGFLPSTVDSSIVRKCCVPTFWNVSRNQI